MFKKVAEFKLDYLRKNAGSVFTEVNRIRLIDNMLASTQISYQEKLKVRVYQHIRKFLYPGGNFIFKIVFIFLFLHVDFKHF